MGKKNELLIFFTALVMIGVTFTGGVFYLKEQQGPSQLLADAAAVTGHGSGVATDTIQAVNSTTTITTQPALILPYSLAKQSPSQLVAYWPKSWGSLSITNGALTLDASTTTSGASTFLLGDASWTNYAVDVNMKWLAGGSFDVAARVASNTEDFVYCEFSSKLAVVVQRVNGKDTELAHASSPNGAAGTSQELGINVYGNDVGCTVAGKEVLGVHVAKNEFAAGGIGLIAWDTAVNKSHVQVNSLSVNALTKNTITVPFPKPVVVAPTPPVATTTPPKPAPTPTPTPAPANPTSTPPVATTTPPKPAPAPAPVILKLPYAENNFIGNKNWTATWGTMVVNSNGFLDLTPTKASTGATVILKNLTLWSDGMFTVNMNWVKGESFGLFARYKDNRNYVLCDFQEQDPGDFVMRLEQYINGRELTLGKSGIVNLNDLTDRSNITAAIELNGLYGTCMLNGHAFSNAGGTNMYVINAPYPGTVGITAYSPTPNASEVIVQSVEITD